MYNSFNSPFIWLISKRIVWINLDYKLYKFKTSLFHINIKSDNYDFILDQVILWLIPQNPTQLI